MEKMLYLDTSRECFISWIEDYDRPLNLQRVRKSLEKNVWQMEYINLTSTEDGRTIAQPIPNVIWFKIIPLASDRIECMIKCSHPMFQDYCSQLLSDIHDRWPQKTNSMDEVIERIGMVRDEMNQGFEKLSLNQEILQMLNTEQKEQLSNILKLLQLGRLDQGEMNRTVDAIRRALRSVLSDKSLIETDAFAILRKQENAIGNASDLRHKFELSIPLIPFLSYKVEWSSDMKQDFDNLQQAWQQLINKLNH